MFSSASYLNVFTFSCTNRPGPDNIKLQIKISLDSTVLDLKNAISTESGVEAERQRLIYSGMWCFVSERSFLC